MTETRQFLINNGVPIVFGAVFVEQIGLPLQWLLRRRGFKHVRPLLGELDAWREQNHPFNKQTSPQPSQQIEEGVPHS